jgi:hypothetical protein
MGNEKMSAVEKYRAQIAQKEAVLVDVTVPSGFVFKFKKPSRYGMLFTMGSLPTSAVSTAVEAWEKEGLKLGEGSDDLAKVSKMSKVIDTVMNLRDKVIDLSAEPKLVIGPAKNENEISTDDVDDEDLEYLFQWVSAGGDASVMLAMFPKRSRANSLASANRPKQRSAAK